MFLSTIVHTKAFVCSYSRMNRKLWLQILTYHIYLNGDSSATEYHGICFKNWILYMYIYIDMNLTYYLLFGCILPIPFIV